jgi:predicted adenylyl cyclase CyaB
MSAAKPKAQVQREAAARPKPQIERELKFAQVDHETLRARLLELEAERLAPPSDEDNWILDRNGELALSASVLRVRQDGRGALITFKGPAAFEGQTKVRRELELRIEDSAPALEMFAALGYGVVRRYQKIREEWRLGSESICLDHTPIGDFVEFEGAKAEAVAKRCGFDPEQAVGKSYLMLYADWILEHPDAPGDMVFRDGK